MAWMTCAVFVAWPPRSTCSGSATPLRRSVCRYNAHRHGNLISYLRSLSDLWDNGYSDAGRKVFFSLQRARRVGLLRLLRTEWAARRVSDLLPGPVILWPSMQGTRFLIPVIPFYFGCLLLGIQGMDSAIAKRWGRKYPSARVSRCHRRHLRGRYSTLRPAGSRGDREDQSVEFSILCAPPPRRRTYSFSASPVRSRLHRTQRQCALQPERPLRAMAIHSRDRCVLCRHRPGRFEFRHRRLAAVRGKVPPQFRAGARESGFGRLPRRAESLHTQDTRRWATFETWRVP